MPPPPPAPPNHCYEMAHKPIMRLPLLGLPPGVLFQLLPEIGRVGVARPALARWMCCSAF